MSAHIRPALPNDVAAVEQIVAAAYSPYIPRMGTRPGPMRDDYARRIAAGCVHVLEQEGIICGLMVLLPEPGAMLLDNVAVDPAEQGKGYGRTLIDFAEQTARDAGLPAIRLYTHETMTENIARYEHLGFQETHRAEENGLKRVFMQKPLA